MSNDIKREDVMSMENKEVKEMTSSGLLDAYIGKRLRLRRLMLQMSQDELAAIIGVTFQQIQKYETGDTKISSSRLFVFAKVLGVDINFFFTGLEAEIPNYKKFEKSIGRVSEEVVKFDPMTSNETLDLVNKYWKLKTQEKRDLLSRFLCTML